MKKYGIIGIVFVGVAVICAFTFRGHKEADYLLTDFPAEASAFGRASAFLRLKACESGDSVL